jgi:hypothetical protein
VDNIVIMIFINKQSGNVLFIILIAVALFAALSYTVMQSTRGGGDVEDEKAGLIADRMLQYGASIKVSLDRIRIINGCSLPGAAGVFFGDPELFPGKCNIFDKINGGGAQYKLWPDGNTEIYGTYTFTAFPGKSSHVFNTMDISGIGTTVAETVFFIFNIKKSICKAINQAVGINTPGNEPPAEETPYEGGYRDQFNGNTPIFRVAQK